MKTHLALIALLFALGCGTPEAPSDSSATTPAPADTEMAPVTSSELNVFELRTYYAADGKLNDLLARFRDHTTQIFERHGMTNVAYWVPMDNEDSTLVYILGYPSRAERDSAWAGFRTDPDWVEARRNSELNGSLIDSVKSRFLTPTDFSPELVIEEAGPRVFEMRTYYATEGKLADLHARFRDYTMALFEKHGISNIAYFDYDTDQPGAENTLLYVVSHESVDTGAANWEGFFADPEWRAAYEATNANGSLMDSLTSVYLTPVDFSPLK